MFVQQLIKEREGNGQSRRGVCTDSGEKCEPGASCLSLTLSSLLQNVSVRQRALLVWEGCAQTAEKCATLGD